MVWTSKPGRRGLPNHCAAVLLPTKPSKSLTRYNEQYMNF